ncbi:hypothetical protein [Spirochaeta cellobiosiphila]|uniref:hypothetical protein n=1 Tax=Spirochaeta cellobiosiphila TaxID=504483 RepID=UPI0004009998|nr:hypothetical protein [Spirochaeta cellobiosiphila]
MIEKGLFIEALNRDIASIRDLFGSKYDLQIAEALEYYNTIDPEKLKPRTNNENEKEKNLVVDYLNQ